MMRKYLSSVAIIAGIAGIALTSTVFAEDGIYDKDKIRGFISLGGDYRNMNSAYINYVNRVLFGAHGTAKVDPVDSTYYISPDNDIGKYDHFDDVYLGLHVNIGAQYKQFRTWFDVNFMPTQVSEKPADYSTTTGYELYDAKWFSYGVDWMFGWKLFGENAVINLIPSAGFGFNLLNLHLTSDYDFLTDTKGSSYISARNRYYSTFAPTFNAEMELQLNIDPIAVGAYGGYRVIRYDELNIEGRSYGDPDVNGDTWFIGGRLTWTFKSEAQRKLEDKL
jgi:hypothetical protein